LQKPEVLTTFGRSESNNYIYLNIRDLTPAMYGHCIPAKSGQGHWLFQLIHNLVETHPYLKYSSERAQVGIL
jgi:hypothetical protein